MNEEINHSSDVVWNQEMAENAYSAVAICLEHIQISGLLIASLAHAVGEEKLRQIVQSEPWQLYLASKRQLEEARQKIAPLTQLLDKHRSPQHSS
jgi:hypothetical protein